MAFREVGMFEVKEVLRLHLGGMQKKPIARTVGVDVKTVRRYVDVAVELGLTLPLDDAKLAAVYALLRSEVQREHGDAYKACAAQREYIKKLVDEGVRLTKVRKLLKRTRDVEVPYSALYRFAVKELAFRVQHSVRVVDPAAGKEVQIDTGVVVTLTGLDGTQTKKKAFIFTPSVSRHRFVYPIDHETTEAAIEACEAAWAFYGGIFEVVLPDNTKAIVEKAHHTSPKIIEAMLEYGQARGITFDPARARKPKDKARVEKSVAFVRDDCYGGETIRTLEEARTRALFWCEHEAGIEPHSTTKRRPKEHFLTEEQPKLKPAPPEPYDVPIWGELTVDDTQHVSFAGALYMLPESLVDHTLRARADKSLVRFYENNVPVKVLPRAPLGGRSFDEDDYPPHKRAYAMRDEQFFVREAHAHGAALGAFAEGVVADTPAPWLRLRRLSKLIALVLRFGQERVLVECRRAVDAEMHDVDRLECMLKQRPVVVDDEPPRKPTVAPSARFLRPKDTWAIKKNKEIVWH